MALTVKKPVQSNDRLLGRIEEIYRSRFSHFLRVALAITGDYQEALEAVQEGFGDAIRSRSSFRGEGPLEAWLWRAVVKASRDARRVRREEARLPGESAVPRTCAALVAKVPPPRASHHLGGRWLPFSRSCVALKVLA